MVISEPFGVTLDLWQTLIFEADGSANSGVRRDLRTERTVKGLAEHGFEVDPEAVKAQFTKLSVEITSGHDDGVDRHFENWIRLLVDRLVPGAEEKIGLEAIDAIGLEIDRTFVVSPPHFLDGTHDVLRKLRDRGARVGLISNTGLTSQDMYREWFAETGVLDLFDNTTFSNEQAVSKPNPAIFEVCIDGLGTKSANTLHVGDNMHTDVAGAAKLGMSTVWVEGGTNSRVQNDVTPDYSVASILELPEILDRWLEASSD
ncbi:MAG: HAD family hydrolase [Dehalococcoidia bacterium]